MSYEFSEEMQCILEAYPSDELEVDVDPFSLGLSPAATVVFKSWGKAIRPDNWKKQLRDARGRWVEQWSDSLPTDPFGESDVLPPTPPPEDPVANSKTRFTVSPHGDGYAIFDNGEFHSIPESGTWGAAKKIANRLNDEQRTVKMKYQPQLAKDGGTTFHHGPEWMVQRKWDGVRAIFEVTEDDTKVFSRTGQDLRPQFPEFNDLHEKYPPGIYDGEILALDENGQDDLERIQLRINDKKARKSDEIPVSVKFFDILEADGESTQDQSAEERLATLEAAVGKENTVEVLPADFKVEDIPKSWEGTMSKLRDSKYEVGKRRSTWMKYKLKKSATLKVTGLTEGLGSRKASFGAVLVSDANGVPRGQIGSGFTQEDIDTLLRAQETGDWPLIEVEYRFLSKTGLLTNTAYKGIRHDKDEADRFDGTDGGESTPEEGVAVTVTEGKPNPSKATIKDPTAKIRWWREELATATLADDPDRIAKAEAKLVGLRKFAITNGFDPQNSAFELPEDDLPDGAMQWSRPKKTTGGATIHQSGKYSIESYKDGDAYNTPTQATLFRDGKLVGRFLSVTQAKEAAERHSELPEGSMSDTEFRDYQDRLRTLDIGELENEEYTLRNERQYLDKLTDQEVSDRLGAVESEMIRRNAERLTPSTVKIGSEIGNSNSAYAPGSEISYPAARGVEVPALGPDEIYLVRYTTADESGDVGYFAYGGRNLDDVLNATSSYAELEPNGTETGQLLIGRAEWPGWDATIEEEAGGVEVNGVLGTADAPVDKVIDLTPEVALPSGKWQAGDRVTLPDGRSGKVIKVHRMVGSEKVTVIPDGSLSHQAVTYPSSKVTPDSKPGPEDPVADRIAYAIDKDPSLADSYEELAWRLYDEDEAKFPGQWNITAGGTSGQELALSEYGAEVLDWLRKNRAAPNTELISLLENMDGGTFLQMHTGETFSGWKLHINVGGDPEREAAAYELLRPLVEEQGMTLKLATARVQEMWADRSPNQLGKDITVYLPRRAEAQDHAQQIIDAIGSLTYDGDIENDQMLAPGIGLRFEFSSDPEEDIPMSRYHDWYRSAGQSPDLPLPAPVESTLPTPAEYARSVERMSSAMLLVLIEDGYGDEALDIEADTLPERMAKLRLLMIDKGYDPSSTDLADRIAPALPDQITWWDNELKEAELADNELFRLEASDEEIRASGVRIKKAQAKLSALRTKQGNQTQAKATAEVINSGYYEDLFYWPPEADKYFDSLQKSLLKGKLIFRQGETFTHPQVVSALNDLANLPPESLSKAFTGPRGVQKIYVGEGGVPEHDELQDHRGVRPRGWPKGSTWDNARGGYDRFKRQAIAGTGRGGSASVVLHELAHGLGDATGLDSSAELKAHQSRLYNGLNPYYRQGGRGAAAGMEELFAEGYAQTAIDRQAAVEEFDEEFVAWMEKVTRLENA